MLSSIAKSIINLPLDIWKEIISHLELEDIASLKKTSKSVSAIVSNPEMVVIWRLFLNRLKVIDPTISIGKSSEDFQEQLWQEIEKIVRKQNEEIAHYQSVLNAQLRFTPDPAQFLVTDEITLLTDKLHRILATQGSKITLKEIEEKDRLLNELSTGLIEHCIKKRSVSNIFEESLNLQSTMDYITRLPAAIFLNPAYEAFWKSLVFLDCAYQKLHYISGEIKICTSLKELILASNNLKRLPEEIGECEALVEISCRDNELTVLPKSISKLGKLRSLDCSNNKLTVLPKSISKLGKLRSLDCSNNKLKSLPHILESCETLMLEFNYLSELPQSLVDKFSKEWAEDILEKQKSRSHKRVLEIKPVEPLPHNSFLSSIFSNVGSYLKGYMPSFVPAEKAKESDSDNDSDDAEEFAQKAKHHKPGGF